MIIIIARAEVDPEALEIVEAAMAKMMRATWEEPGCISYSMAVEDRERGIISVVERWEDEAAIKRHFAMPHMAIFNAAVAGHGRSMDAKMYDAANERALPA
ncbi:antibiotic biosynthesis monooxygenase [Polymorphobacter arshaanensis]|uniref:Antibiotic biosynthesis monooxygenase n=1 Tax=Glacieibacterium arshaanense TaxID=2511025 RepID=A0A4Y9ELA8_9SPHN|nr:putative quinol monooxygenase [Polymorphobacter arshaanensis]TFU01216.1 antibiotic biosynthesis monooxygenase [Polymorphobacter arshaanensis]